MDEKPPFWLELLVPGAMVAFGIVYYLDTLELSQQATFFPHTLMWVMGLLALSVLGKEAVARLRPGRDQPGQEIGLAAAAASHRNPALIVLFSFGYLYLFSVTNYTVATIAFVAVFLLTFRVPILTALAVSVLFPLALYGLFGVVFGIRI